MSSFGAKRKARKITVQEDDEDTGLGATPDTTTQSEPQQPQEPPPLQATFKTRKPFKQSSLRKSININDDEPAEESGARIKPKYDAESGDNDERGSGAPLRVRPQLGGGIGRSASTKSKKRSSTATSRLSFGPNEPGGGSGGGGGDGDDDDEDSVMLGGEVFSTPKKTSSVHSTENHSSSTYKNKKGISRKNLPNLPNVGSSGLALRSSTNGDRLYSKEYLSELQNSTPNTPQRNVATFETEDHEMMSLDPSELEGAMVVDDDGSSATAVTAMPHQTEILTEAQIQEKKERRARFAKQTQSSRNNGDDFISLSDDDNKNDQRTRGDSYLAVLSRQSGSGGGAISSNSKKETTRLIPEDEDLGEGFDAFVEDGGLSLGRKAEREARRKQRKQMADLINAAEGPSASAVVGVGVGVDDNEDEDDDDDSEAERHAAYEAAQTRRGMDGLAAEREAQRRRLAGKEGVVPVPHRIAPLPDLSVLVADFGEKVRRRRDEVARARARILELRGERGEVGRREPEVQSLLDLAGERYLNAVGGAVGVGVGGGEKGLEGLEGEKGDANGEVAGNGDGNGGNDVEDNGDNGNAAAERAKSLLDQMRMSGGPGTPLGARGLESLGTTPVRPSRVAEMEMAEDL